MDNCISKGSFVSIQRGIFLFILILFGSVNQVFSQTTIHGIVINKASGDPIEDVYIAWEKDNATLTNRLGEFAIRIRNFPLKMAVSHVSYGLTEVSLDRMPPDPFYIRLEPDVSRIDEVQVSGERLRILTKDDDFSLMDFAFDRHYMWMLGHVNNQVNRQRLFLCTAYGDTITTMPVRRGEKLYRDPFDNVHLLTRDTAFQLFSQGDSIELLYSYPRELFDQTMQGILCGFNNKLVYKDYNPSNYYMRLYYLCEDDHYQHHITMLTDTVGEMSAKQDDTRDEILRAWGITELANMWKTIKSGYKPGSKIASMVLPPILMELFTSNDSLFILNFFKDSLLCYSPEGKFVRSTRIDFHKEELLGGIDYRELDFITDPITHKVYITERRIARWILHPFDPASGKLHPEILLPNFAGMTGIKANNDAIYFLYHEKLHPYYTRLYRYQL